jgi:hypothetical protein
MTLLRTLALASFLLTACTCTADGHPGSPPAQTRRILSDARYEWSTMEAADTRIHFPAGSYAESRREVLGARVRDSRSHVFRMLGQSDDGSLFHVFYVDTREDMAALTGAPATGFSYFSDGAVVLVFNSDWQPFERHELAHVVTLGSWPTPGDMAVVEGLATYLQGQCGGYPNGSVARTIMDQNGLIPLDRLSTDFRSLNDLEAYLQAASVIALLVETQGRGILRTAWELGLGAAPDLLGTTAPDFLSDLRVWLQASFEPIPPAALEAIRRGGCGIPRPT